MSNHRKLLIAFVVLLVCMYLLQDRIGFSNWWYLYIHIIYFGWLAYASMNMELNFFLPSIISGERTDRRIALTFDDGPDEKNTARVLDILKQEGIKGTFFCIGRKIKGQEHLLRRIHNEGHLIGNHSFCHAAKLEFFPPFLIRRDLQKTQDLIQNIIHKKPNLFRPPFGATTPSMALAVRDLKIQSIGWDNRSFDTTKITDDIIIKRIKSKLKPGGIILLHDHLHRQSTLLPQLIQMIKTEGFEIVPLTELLAIKAYV